MADFHLKRAGVTKAVGGARHADLVKAYMPIAEGVAVLEKAVADVLEVRRRQERITDQIGEQIRVLQALNAADNAPLFPGVTGLVDLDLERHGVRLASRKLPDEGDLRYYPGHTAPDPSHDGN